MLSKSLLRCCRLGNGVLARFQSTTINNRTYLVQQIRRGIDNLNSKLTATGELRLADIDWPFLFDEANYQDIQINNQNRKSNACIQRVYEIGRQIETEKNENNLKLLIEQLYNEAVNLCNKTHPDIPIGDYDQCKVVSEYGKKIDKPTPSIDRISKMFGWLKEDHLALYSTQRSHVLSNELADMEVALVNYTLDYLNKKGFTYVTVPDILNRSIIEACGFPTKGERTQIYKLDFMNEYGKYCLSGTSEMSLADLLKNREFRDDELPLKYCAASRCYRAEVSGSEKEGRLYRLHEFTKVEMFVVTKANASEQMLEELMSHQIDLFSGLDLHFRVQNMSSQELGSPAYRKYDIEAWMPANQFYGEISSASNCTDYQSRRLHIKSISDHQYVHTLNGTACAIPRMLTSIIESNWDMENKQVKIPARLQKYMNNKQVLKVPQDFRKAQPLKSFK